MAFNTVNVKSGAVKGNQEVVWDVLDTEAYHVHLM